MLLFDIIIKNFLGGFNFLWQLRVLRIISFYQTERVQRVLFTLLNRLSENKVIMSSQLFSLEHLAGYFSLAIKPVFILASAISKSMAGKLERIYE